MSSLSPAFYTHHDNDAKPPGCQCSYGASTCVQCTLIIKRNIQAVFLGTLSRDSFMTTFRVPGVVSWVVENLRFFDTQVLNATSAESRDNSCRGLAVGLWYLTSVILRNVDPTGSWPAPMVGYQNILTIMARDRADGVPTESHTELDAAIDTCGEIVRIIYHKLIAPPRVTDKTPDEDNLIWYIYIVAYAARRWSRTIRNFTECAIPLLFRVSVGPTMPARNEFAWFCLSCICKPDHQWNMFNGGPNPIFQVVWNTSETGIVIREQNQNYIPVQALLDKMCAVLKTITGLEQDMDMDLAVRRMEWILNVAHGTASMTEHAAIGIARHPQFLELLAEKIALLSCLIHQETHAVFNQAIKNVYVRLSDIWDKALLVSKVAPILFRTGQWHGECEFLRVCIHLWGSSTDHFRMIPITPMQNDANKPFMLTMLGKFCEDLLSFQYSLGPMASVRNVLDQYPEGPRFFASFAALWTEFSTSSYRSSINDTFKQALQTGMVQVPFDKQEMWVKCDALKQEIAQMQNICVLLGILKSRNAFF
ncbi:hypothetical protein BJ165DRAFT_1463401 [Panaeolus papilionaceus]|nr:hypothetical protein BJ165DRAFT_1463401 [Panaeolus papilionaceus]